MNPLSARIAARKSDTIRQPPNAIALDVSAGTRSCVNAEQVAVRPKRVSCAGGGDLGDDMRPPAIWAAYVAYGGR
jgi:hypothetical protein